MNMNSRLQKIGKQPAILIVPEHGTKRSWLDKYIKAQENDANYYLFKVITENSNFPNLFGKLKKCYKTVIILNNAVQNKGNLHTIGNWYNSTSGANIYRYHITRKKNFVALIGTVPPELWAEKVLIEQNRTKI